MKNIESPYASEIYTTKTIVLVEDEPGSDKYSEVMLTREQANKVRDVLQEFFIKVKHEPDCDCPSKDMVSFLVPTADVKEVHLPQFKGEYTQDEVDDAYKRVIDEIENEEDEE